MPHKIMIFMTNLKSLKNHSKSLEVNWNGFKYNICKQLLGDYNGFSFQKKFE